MKSEYHLGTILLTNGVHNNHIHLHEKSHRHLTSVTVIEPTKSNSTPSGKVIGFNTNQTKGSCSMSANDNPRITHKVNLAAAFHDHISCTKLPSQITKNGGDINSLIGVSLNNSACIDTNNSLFGAAAGSINEDKIQIKRLKDMILMQLDLIQHQQEQLLKKERQLQGLKNDRETLCLKIEKMESRINFLTRKLLETNSGTSTLIIGDTTHTETISELNAQSSDSEMMISCLSDTNDMTGMFTNVYSTPSPLSTSNPAIVSPRTCNSNLLAPSPSNQSLQLTSGTEILSSGDNDDTSDHTKPKPSSNSGKKKVKTETSKKKSEEIKEEKKSNSKDNKKSAVKRKRPTNTKSVAAQTNKGDLPISSDKSIDNESADEKVSSTKSCSKKRRRTVSRSSSSTIDQLSVNSVNCKQTSTNVNSLDTDELYDLFSCQDDKDTIQRNESSSLDVTIKGNQIEVPSWRIIHIPDSLSTDGIESLDDDTFLKRHQKLESDEKRRKRWDIQRLREQRLNERLRSGRYYNNNINCDNSPGSNGSTNQAGSNLSNFFPRTKEVQFIEVSDKIPGMAFGLPIPNLPPKAFSLPWLKSSRQT